MKQAIEEICTAQLCLQCQISMEDTHLIRCIGSPQKTVCQRCGKEGTAMQYIYLMKGKELRRRGLV